MYRSNKHSRFRRKALFVGGKNALGVDPVPRVAFSCEMINQRRLVSNATLFPLYQMREIVIFS
jgi:hypothetical protein